MPLTIALIKLLDQHGDASKQQADAKGVNTHQAVLFSRSTQGLSVMRKYQQQDWQALFASPSQLQALLASTVLTIQRDIMRRREQKDQYVEYELSKIGKLRWRMTSPPTSIASKMLRPIPS